jgi:hypothetical protein
VDTQLHCGPDSIFDAFQVYGASATVIIILMDIKCGRIRRECKTALTSWVNPAFMRRPLHGAQ